MIKAIIQKTSTISKTPTVPNNALVITPEVINPAKTISDTKTVDLATAITNLQNDILQNSDRNVDELDDDDSRDEDLVIDMKEDELPDSNKSTDNISENDKCNYTRYIPIILVLY